MNQKKEAIDYLTRAQQDRDPLMVWLHRWPLFAKLRQQKAFQSLVREMNLPAAMPEELEY